MPEFLILKTPAEARRILEQFPAVEVERVGLLEAAERVLAEEVLAPEDLPAFRRATMDGYAVRAADVAGASEGAPAYLKLRGSAPMGGVFPGRVGVGEAVAISTGGAVPEGADAVVMLEYTQPVGGVLLADAAPAATGRVGGQGGDDRAGESAAPGIASEVAPEIEVHRGVVVAENVVLAGDDVRAGVPVLAAGRRLRPQDVGCLAALGILEVAVYRQPRIAVLATGNEIVPPWQCPLAGQVRDVNQYAIAAAVRRAGCLPVAGGIVRDDAREMRGAVAALLATCDGVLLSGGSSVGVRDVAAEVLASLGPPGILFHGISVRPGKPTLVARIGDRPVIGLPGHPVSSQIIFDLFVRPLLYRLAGEPRREPWPARGRAVMARSFPSVPGREDWVRVRLLPAVCAGGPPRAEPLLGGSAMLVPLVLADGLVRIAAECEGLPEGEEVEVLLYG